MILLLDNYDSFVHNIARYLRLGGKATRVIRSDSITAIECLRLEPEAIVLSPGPHGPIDAGCCLEVVQSFSGIIPILGICLGHQCIAQAYGGEIVRTPPMHAMSSTINHDATGIFAGMPSQLNVGRYHSLCVQPSNLPPSLQVTAWTQTPSPTKHSGKHLDPSSVIMGISDHSRCVHVVQFHPESLLTEHGQSMLNNFFALVDRHQVRMSQVTDAAGRIGPPVVWSALPPDHSPEDLSSQSSPSAIVPTLSISSVVSTPRNSGSRGRE